MRLKTIKRLLEVVTIVYGAALWVVANYLNPEVLPLGWIAPAFFIVYETVFVGMLGRYEKMTPQWVVYSSMILRGVKFLGVAAMMLVWVMLELPAKQTFLIYTLGYYLLSSLFEGWCVSAYNKERQETK